MTNRGFLLLITGLFFLSMPLSLSAQSGRYVIEQRFVQRLAWIGDEYVLRYEVVIERDEGKGYRVFMRDFTESPGLQISLLPGNYRYQVIPFDFLEQAGEASDWVTLNVLPAPIIPVEVQAIGDDNYLLHSDSELLPGVNEIIIKNLDDLKTNEGVITIEKQEPSEGEKRINIYLCAAWVPLLPLYGGMQQVFGNEFFASGTALRFGVLYTKLTLFNPGLELSTSWYALNNVQDDSKIKMQAGVIGFNILAQKWLPNRKMAFTFRAGGGLGFQIGELSNGQDMYPMGGLVPQINLEPSFLWQALKQLYLETGLSYALFLSQNNSSGCLRPWIGIGWNF